MTEGQEQADEVGKLAAAITRLQPAERERLFELLSSRGHLPPSTVGRPLDSTQMARKGNNRKDRWSPDYLLIFDGGSKGNPGKGYGSYAIIRTQDGAQRVERVDFGDGYTNNEAEYDSLIAGLQDLLDRIEEAERQPQ